MPVGSIVRGLFGAQEHRVAALYRSIFLDVDSFAELIQQWAPEPRNILEVGCGEGAITEKLAQLYPRAQITAIDITPKVGRLYRGRSQGVEFSEVTVQALAATRSQEFDLILLSDVMHHVPEALRADILESIHALLALDGIFLLKDWEHGPTPIHWLCHATDRWLTGDRVRYLRKGEADELIASALPDAAIVDVARIRPWHNNFAMLIRAGR